MYCRCGECGRVWTSDNITRNRWWGYYVCEECEAEEYICDHCGFMWKSCNEFIVCDNCKRHIKKQDNNIIEAMNKWRKEYHNKFKNWNIFWEMFFKKLEEELENNSSH